MERDGVYVWKITYRNIWLLVELWWGEYPYGCKKTSQYAGVRWSVSCLGCLLSIHSTLSICYKGKTISVTLCSLDPVDMLLVKFKKKRKKCIRYNYRFRSFKSLRFLCQSYFKYLKYMEMTCLAEVSKEHVVFCCSKTISL